MKGMYEQCAGLDVDKKTVVACMRDGNQHETQTFGTMTAELLTLMDWRLRHQVTPVAMEVRANFGNRTSTYWKATSRCCWSTRTT